MPLICSFNGINIYMYYIYGEHEPPHIHALYQGKSAIINIVDYKIKGQTNVPKSIISKIIKWMEKHQEELLQIWRTQVFNKISPDY